MKKISTMLGVLALCGGSAFAATGMTLNPGVRTDLKVTGTTQAFQQMQASNKALGDVIASRSFTGTNGKIYEQTFQMYQQPINEMLTFSDADGNPIKPTFDELPYYCVHYQLTAMEPGQSSPDTMIVFELVWPSQYMYEQLWSYTGETEVVDGKVQIPVALREYYPASFEDLCNNDARCRTFREADGVGVGDPVNGKYAFYTMLPNEALGTYMYYGGKLAVTTLTQTTASEILFNQFDPETLYMDNLPKIYYNFVDPDTMVIDPIPHTERVYYKGTVEMQGIMPTETVAPEFGDLHLFNGGLVSSDILGDNNPFPADFGEMTQMAFAIGDKYLVPGVRPDVTKFNTATFFDGNPSDFYMSPENLPKGEEREHNNMFLGYLFADAKYGKNPKLDIDPKDFNLVKQVQATQVDLGNDEWFAVAAPEVGGMIPYGVGTSQGVMEPWSATYGAFLSYRGLGQQGANTPVYMGWGFKDGFVLHFENEFLNTISVTSTGRLYYHYDPNNVQNYKLYDLVGDADMDSVEAVVADNAKVVAANGVITVMPADDAEVAVYGLDGVCVKNVKANAGETVNVEAQKGVYVVVVNGASKKVAL